jgi:hypothetical protein
MTDAERADLMRLIDSHNETIALKDREIALLTEQVELLGSRLRDHYGDDILDEVQDASGRKRNRPPVMH